MAKQNIGRKPTSDDYLFIFVFTILFAVIGLLLSALTYSLIWIFLAIISGIMIDGLRFAVIVYFAKLPKENINEQEERNE